MNNLLGRLKTGSTVSRICVLTQYLGTLYYLAAEIEQHGMDYSLIHGGTSSEDRRGALNLFSGEDRVLTRDQRSHDGRTHCE